MVIESAIILRPRQTLAYLVSVNYADTYMQTFVTYIDAHESFLATHLASLSLAALFTIPFNELPPSYRGEMPRLFELCMQLANEVQRLKKQRDASDKANDDVDYEELMDRLYGQSFKQNDWGFNEDCDVDDDDDLGEFDLKQLEDLGGIVGDCSEIDDHLFNNVTVIDEVTYMNQAFNVGARGGRES